VRSRLLAIAIALAVTVVVVAVWTSVYYGVQVEVAAPVQSVKAKTTIAGRGEMIGRPVSRTTEVDVTGGGSAEPATGDVVIEYHEAPFTGLNCASSHDCPPLELTLPAGTRVATCVPRSGFTCDGFDVQFALVSAVHLKRDVFSEPVAIRAVEPGPRGNIFAGSVIGLVDPPAVRGVEFRIRNDASTTGGRDAQSGVVGQADADRAVESMRKGGLDGDARRSLDRAARARGLRAAYLRTDVQTSVDPPVGTASPRARVTVVATARGLGYRAAEREAARAAAAKRATPKGQFPVPSDSVFMITGPAGDRVQIVALLDVSPVDPALVHRISSGRTTGSACRALERRYGQGSVRIHGRPQLLPWLPFRRSRIDVVVTPVGPHSGNRFAP
jgi:hypothetical protein